jgi:hypothetical protein
MKRLPEQVAQGYVITYVHEHCVELQPLQSELGYVTTVLTNKDSLQQAATFRSVEYVLHDLERRGVLKQSKRAKKKQQLVIDTRFDKRIIVKFVGETKLGRLG